MRIRYINDPVYGLIPLRHPSICQIVDHPWFQRLRYIRQLGLTDLVFPSATHTRFQHALGTYYLGALAVETLREKGISITQEEEESLLLALLLHDLGHGPYSHALEHILLREHHETITQIGVHHLLQTLNISALEGALHLLKGKAPRPFLNQLVKSQLDLDRLDYLARDSFFAGVSEGHVGYERIIRLLTITPSEHLAVEAKGYFSIERFLLARLSMYHQVYLHKTVIASEGMLQKVFELLIHQIRENAGTGSHRTTAWFQQLPPALHTFLQKYWIDQRTLADCLPHYFALTDADAWITLQILTQHFSPATSIGFLAQSLIQRTLHKVYYSGEHAPPQDAIAYLTQQVQRTYNLPQHEARHLVFVHTVTTVPYLSDSEDAILFVDRDGTVYEFFALSPVLTPGTFSIPHRIYFLCAPYLTERTQIQQTIRQIIHTKSPDRVPDPDPRANR